MSSTNSTDPGQRPPFTVVLPTYNEVEAIEGVIRGFQAAVIDKEPDAELLVAEDGSTDGTKELLKTLQAELGFTLVQGAERKGYLKGVRDALTAASGEWVFFCDTDGTHDPDDFWRLWEARELGDIIAGKKVDRKDPPYRLAASWAYNRFISTMFGFRVRDSNAGFKLMNRRVVEEQVPKVHRLKLGFSTELLVRCNAAGLRIHQVPVKHFDREGGEADQFPLTKMWSIGWDTYSRLRALKKELRG